MPQVAMVASWMEALKMPMRQIRKVYTKSELAIMGWRGSEMSYNLSLRHSTQVQSSNPRQNGFAAEPHFITALESRLEPLALKFVDDNGEIDLRRLTGQEAMHYMAAMGIPMGRS